MHTSWSWPQHHHCTTTLWARRQTLDKDFAIIFLTDWQMTLKISHKIFHRMIKLLQDSRVWAREPTLSPRRLIQIFQSSFSLSNRQSVPVWQDWGVQRREQGAERHTSPLSPLICDWLGTASLPRTATSKNLEQQPQCKKDFIPVSQTEERFTSSGNVSTS